MIVQVSGENEAEWAELCVLLWPEYTADYMLQGKAGGELFKNEFLYYCENKPVGLISLSLRTDYVEGTNSSPVGYIEGIYVKKAYRHKGIARELVEYAKKWSLRNGCLELGSDCILNNETSRIFHSKVGFKEANTIVCFTMTL